MQGVGRALALLSLLFLAQAAAAAEARAPGAVFRDCEGCPEMVVLPAGMFPMGTPGATRGQAGAEAQVVVIDIARPFALARREVTRGEFARFVAASGHEQLPGCRTWDPALGRFSDDGRRGWQNPATPATLADGLPVSCVSFADATAYAQWLAKTTGAHYRLPSEAEWEYAARAGSAALRPWGDAADGGCEFANAYDLTSQAAYRLGWPAAACRDGFTDVAPVGSFVANAFGLFDLIGNVQEWVQDCATDSYVGRPRDSRAWEWLGGCRLRIVRGGGWHSPPERARSAFRASLPANQSADDTGFRVALDLAGRGEER